MPLLERLALHSYMCPASFKGSGITTLIKNNSLKIVNQSIIVPGHILYTKLYFNSATYHTYNVLMHQTDERAFHAIRVLADH